MIKGIDYVVEECPLVAGNTVLRYKDALNAIEQHAPGTKAQFLYGFLERVQERHFGTADAEAGDLVALRRVRPADHRRRSSRRRTRRGLRVLPHSRPAAHRLVDAVTQAPRWPGHPDPLSPGERILLIDGKQRRYTQTLATGGVFHFHGGMVEHDALLGRPEGTTVTSTKQTKLLAVRMTNADWTLKAPRGAQVVYPKDQAMIVALADIRTGNTVVEAGAGSGALTCALLQAVGPTGRVTSFERREDHADVARRNVADRLGGHPDNWELRVADAVEGLAGCAPIGSCSTCSSRGTWSRPRTRRCTRAGCSSRTPRPSPRSCASARHWRTTAGGAWRRPRRRCCAPGTWTDSPCAPTTAWSRIPLSFRLRGRCLRRTRPPPWATLADRGSSLCRAACRRPRRRGAAGRCER